MPEAIKEVSHAGKKIQIFHDLDPINPLKDYDTMVEIAHWHPRYNLGEQIQHTSAQDMIQKARLEKDPILAILPLYLYDHSGISVSTKSFSCSFDSGMVGWAYITKSNSASMGCEHFTKEQYEDAIRNEVKTFDAYLTGQVFGYKVLGIDGAELESSWSYFDMDDCLKEAMGVAEIIEDPAQVRQDELLAEEMAARATYAGSSSRTGTCVCQGCNYP